MCRSHPTWSAIINRKAAIKEYSLDYFWLASAHKALPPLEKEASAPTSEETADSVLC